MSTTFFLAYGCRESRKTTIAATLFVASKQRGMDSFLSLNSVTYGSSVDDYTPFNVDWMLQEMWDLNGNHNYIFCDFDPLNSAICLQCDVNLKAIFQTLKRFNVHHVFCQKGDGSDNLWFDFATKNGIYLTYPDHLLASIQEGVFI